MRRHLLAAAFVLAAVPFPGCTDEEKGNIVLQDTILDFERPPNPTLEIVPQELSFTHVVGRSDCPQLVGRVRVRHRADGTFLYRVSVVAPLALRVGTQLFRSQEVNVGRGDGEEIEVVFDCSSQASPVVQTVTFRDDVSSARGAFVVNGTVVR